MNKNIKAELFRLTHSGSIFRIYIVCGLLTAVLPVVILPDSMNQDLLTTVAEISEQLCMYIPLLIGTLIGIMASKYYHCRLYYYEIMDGAGIHRIILSKMAVYGIVSLAVIIPSLVIFAIAGVRGGVGEMKSPLLFGLIYAVIVFHIVIKITLYSMLIRNLIGGSLIAYALAIVEIMGFSLITELELMKTATANRLFQWVPSIQLMLIPQAEYSADYIIAVFGSLILGTAVLYSLVYTIYKKRLFR